MAIGSRWLPLDSQAAQRRLEDEGSILSDVGRVEVSDSVVERAGDRKVSLVEQRWGGVCHTRTKWSELSQTPTNASFFSAWRDVLSDSV